MIGLLLVLLAAAALALGADLFADNVGALAHRLHVRSTTVALVLAGAEPEELATAKRQLRAEFFRAIVRIVIHENHFVFDTLFTQYRIESQR